ncbi:MAG: hypothetical protein ABJZ55_04360 [Fuerstiella sp.]
MFETATDIVEPDRLTRYRISSDGAILPYSTVLNLWQSDQTFREHFTALLNESPFSGYRWETPAITAATVDRPFEFVLINTPGFSDRKTDGNTYGKYFSHDDTDAGIVAFRNLGGDATLIVPSPRVYETAYGHLAAFVRNAPQTQVHSIWCVIAKQVQSQIGTKPLWVSTAGGGVAWLHVRLDARPKYYGHAPYKTG